MGWAGWNHRRQAQALAGYFTEMRDKEGWPLERLSALLAGLLELVPWLKQWHNEIDPEYGLHMGDFYEDFVRQEARNLGLTLDALRAWRPPEQPRRGRRRRRAPADRSEAAQ